MAEVQVPLFDAQHVAQKAVADKLRDVRLAVEALGLRNLANDLGGIEDRLRATTFTLEVVTGGGAKLIAQVPD